MIQHRSNVFVAQRYRRNIGGNFYRTRKSCDTENSLLQKNCFFEKHNFTSFLWKVFHLWLVSHMEPRQHGLVEQDIELGARSDPRFFSHNQLRIHTLFPVFFLRRQLFPTFSFYNLSFYEMRVTIRASHIRKFSVGGFCSERYNKIRP
jgi:hypothetical protein